MGFVMSSCIYNNRVECAKCNRNCANCGWNPKVAARRLSKRPCSVNIKEVFKYA